ncbi:MAG: hypothetical protein L0228_09315 [Planctomycetes bacterium]|nr:hypothetical protein [Planctomycetota bacterium]
MCRVVCTFMALLLIEEASAQSQGAAHVAELRDRGLYEQAAEQGREQWERGDLSDRERAELAIQLALVYTEQALAAAPASRGALWANADAACAALLDGSPNNPRWRLVEVQRALVSLARGIQARESSDHAAAVEHLRAAVRALAAVAEAVGRDLIDRRLRRRNDLPRDALSVAELESLELHVAYHLARAERQTALCHAAGTADRDDLLLQASRRLTPLVTQTPADELVWNARVELVACQRELGNPQTAQRLIDAWLKEDPPVDIVNRLAAEKAQPESAVAATLPSPADAPSGKVVNDTAVREAEADRAAGRFAAAARKFREFALSHPEQARSAEAHRIAILCTTDLLRETAPGARATIAETYEELLQEHLRAWPTQATADDVRMWLGRLLAGRCDWSASVAVLQPVRPTSAHYVESVMLVADCYGHQLRQLDANGPPNAQQRAELLAAATRYLQPVITGADNRWPNPWSELQRDTAVSLARLHVRYADPTSPYAVQLLSAALQGNSDVEDPKAGENWRSTARTLLVVALARNGKVADAGDRRAALAHYAAAADETPDDGDVQEQYAMLWAASNSPDELRQSLARWQAVESRSRRGGERWRRARRARIELLTRLGDSAEAEKLVRLTRLLYPDWDTTSTK